LVKNTEGGGIAGLTGEKLTIFSLRKEEVLLVVELLDMDSALAFLRCCQWFNSMLSSCDSFWKMLCIKTEFANYSCLETQPASRQLGWAGLELHNTGVRDRTCAGQWRRTWQRGIKMRRNVVAGNYQGWRFFSNSECPVAELSPTLDMNKVKQNLGEFPKLTREDTLKIDWDDKHLVLFHSFWEGASCTSTIRLWDIEDEPRFLYEVDRGIECISHEVSVHNGHVVMIPMYPLEAEAIVMTLDINNNMTEIGKYLFADSTAQTALDDNWEHTQLRVVRCQALVVCRAPAWQVVITSLPCCTPLTHIPLDQVSSLYECQQIRSYKSTAVVLFTEKKAEQVCTLVTMDICGTTGSKVRSYYSANNVTVVALTEPEEIHLMKKNGTVVLYDATAQTETVKIDNSKCSPVTGDSSDYQLFVNGKEQICVMQSAPEAPSGRHINVYTYSGVWLYEINLDLYQYGLSRDESVCIYTNAAFLAAADSKRFVLFNVKNGNFVGVMMIPNHLERSKGKDEIDCLMKKTGLVCFTFKKNKIIALQDYERIFPAVLDIYKFW